MNLKHQMQDRLRFDLGPRLTADSREHLIHEAALVPDAEPFRKRTTISWKEAAQLPLAMLRPSMHERRFVLVPLCDVAADDVHPRLGLTFRALLAACPDTSRVVPYTAAAGAAR